MGATQFCPADEVFELAEVLGLQNLLKGDQIGVEFFDARSKDLLAPPVAFEVLDIDRQYSHTCRTFGPHGCHDVVCPEVLTFCGSIWKMIRPSAPTGPW